MPIRATGDSWTVDGGTAKENIYPGISRKYELYGLDDIDMEDDQSLPEPVGDWLNRLN